MSEASSFHVYRYRLRPMRQEQTALALQAFGNSRWAYNRMVAINRDMERLGAHCTSGVEAINLLPDWKIDQEWLSLGPSQPLQQTLIDYAQAQTAHRQDSSQYGAPTFKSRHDLNASLRFPQPKASDWNPQKGWVNLPKLGQLRYFKDSRLPQGILKQVSLVREGDRWMVCLCVEQSADVRKAQKKHQLPEHPKDLSDLDVGGIDLGHVHAATDHHGQHFDFPMQRVAQIDDRINKLQALVSHKREAGKALRKHYKEQSVKAAKLAQDAIKASKPSSKAATSTLAVLPKESVETASSHCDKRPRDSKRMTRARMSLRKLQTKRRDVLTNARHQLSHHLTETFPVLGVEDLAIKKLMANAKRTERSQVTDAAATGNASSRFKPTHAKPGKKPMPRVREKALHRGWAALGAGIFVSQLQYKAARKGGLVVKVNPAYTSQTCPICQHIDTNNRESQAVFRCTACGFEGHADKVGALNVRTRAMETLMNQGFPQPKPPKHRRPRNPRKKPQTAWAA